MAEEKDLLIVAQSAMKDAIDLVVSDPTWIDEEETVFDLAHRINDEIWNIAGVERPAVQQKIRIPAGGATPPAQPPPQVVTEQTAAQATDSAPPPPPPLTPEVQGALATAMAQLPEYQAVVTGSPDEVLWADCLLWHPESWYDNRGNKKTAKHPDFRHKSVKDKGGERGVGLWINGTAPVPGWVHTVLPYRGMLEPF